MSFSSTLLQYSVTNHDAIESPSRLSETSVILHELCANCTQFCEQWKVLDHVCDSRTKTETPWPMLYLCSIAHLVAHQTRCHLCKILLARLQGVDGKRTRDNINLKIYLQARVKEEGGEQIIDARTENESRHEDEESSGFASLLLSNYKHSIGQGFQQHITAQSVPFLAHNNLERARSWIECCKSEHKTCGDFHRYTVKQNDRRPTRILEVTANSVKLRCSTSNMRLEYLALSHMWGESSEDHIKLKLENIDRFQVDIPWSKLSSIYKEAIRVTIALGYKFLWIDSLCIIQDSDTDWKQEAALMATVYGNTACNLAFLFPSYSSETLTRSDPRVWNPCILRLATSSRPGVYIHHNTDSSRRAYQDVGSRDWLIQSKWPLFTRAWTFQEYLLSPRTLLLGHRNLMWQCSAGFHDELLGPIAEAPRILNDTTPKHGRDMGKTRYFPPYLQPGFGKHVLTSAPKSLFFILDWQALMDEYRGRNLTFAKDRTIAFAGIARAFHNLGSLTYLAGAWKEFFPLCLLWYLDQKSRVAVRNLGPVERRGGTLEYPIQVKEEGIQTAPSWSQFSMPVYTHHQTCFMFNDDEVFIRSKSVEQPPRVYWHDMFWISFGSYTFGDNATGDFPESGFYDFTALKVTLNIPVLSVKVSWPANLEEHFERIRANDPQDAELQWKPVFMYYPDQLTTLDITPSPPKRSVLALVAEFQVCRVAGRYNIQRRFGGLVLVRGEQEGTWKRVGAWKLQVKIRNIEVTRDNVEQVAKRWKDHRIWTLGDAWKGEKITLI